MFISPVEIIHINLFLLVIYKFCQVLSLAGGCVHLRATVKGQMCDAIEKVLVVIELYALLISTHLSIDIIYASKASPPTPAEC